MSCHDSGQRTTPRVGHQKTFKDLQGAYDISLFFFVFARNGHTQACNALDGLARSYCRVRRLKRACCIETHLKVLPQDPVWRDVTLVRES